MIVSASRRTDIPAYYGEWFINRLKEKYALVRNPFNHSYVSRINLLENEIDCIVFWTKNSAPFIEWLQYINIPYYFLFTITGYDKDLERSIPGKELMIDAFINLSSKCGRERVIWRYDPVVLTDKYTAEWHIRNFSGLAEKLHPYTGKCIFSFLHIYAKCKNNLRNAGSREITDSEKIFLGKEMGQIALSCHIELESCATETDLSVFGIKKGGCINKSIIENITGADLKVSKDKNQRKYCGCVESVDIGSYNTCPGNCLYCYANSGFENAWKNFKSHDPKSPLLCGHILKSDQIFDRI
jgi:hypothetical protein